MVVKNQRSRNLNYSDLGKVLEMQPVKPVYAPFRMGLDSYNAILPSPRQWENSPSIMMNKVYLLVSMGPSGRLVKEA